MKRFLAGLFMALFLTTNAFATVSNQTNKVFATGNSSTKAFSFSFKIFSSSELQVYLINPSGTVFGPLTLTSDYTVSINTSSEGGTVTFVTAPTSNWQIFIRRIEPYTQGLAISTEGPLPSKQIENQLDLSMMTIIQLNEAVARCIQYPIASQLGTLTFPTPEADTAIGWNSTGTGLTNVSVVGPQGPAGPAGDGTGDVLIGSATTTDGRVALWDGSNTKVLKDGPAIGTTASCIVQLNASAQLPPVSAALLTNFPTLNQNTTGTASNLTAGTSPLLPTGTTAHTYSQADNSTHIATTAYADAASGIPSGVIVMWHGSIATIPAGWALCNGSNGTPDLRNRFVVCADADVNTVAESTVTGSALQTSDGVIPAHTHTVVANNTGLNGGTTYGAADRATGGSDSILTTSSTGTGSINIAVFYALAYIMKL